MISAIPSALLQEIETQTGSSITNFSFSSGGCINKGGWLSTSNGPYFLKWNDQKKFPGMFAAEARGLSLLHASDSVKVPRVILTGAAGGFQFLLLEYIEEARKISEYWQKLGIGLASLHKNTASQFGLDHDNYVGSLPQNNERSSSWVEFFVSQRLQVQLQRANDQGKIDKSLLKKFDSLFAKLPLLFPEEIPSLLHGDLWGGNIMTTSRAEPCLIDPAVYYGHREADLAMTQLFGGFDPSFMDGYREMFPLHPGFNGRFDLYNLYPLLVHLNLFGGGYSGQVVSIVNRFVV